MEEMSQEQRDVLDPKLFVGDRGGLKKLKTDSRRMVSRPDIQLVFMSGFRGEEEELGEGGSKRAEIKEMEVRELETSNDTDDPDMSEAVALIAGGWCQDQTDNWCLCLASGGRRWSWEKVGVREQKLRRWK